MNKLRGFLVVLMLFFLVGVVLGQDATNPTPSPPHSSLVGGESTGFAVPSETVQPSAVSTQLSDNPPSVADATFPPTGVGGEDSATFGDWWVANGEDALQNLLILGLGVMLLRAMFYVQNSLPPDMRKEYRDMIPLDKVPEFLGKMAQGARDNVASFGEFTASTPHWADDVGYLSTKTALETLIAFLESNGFVVMPKDDSDSPLDDSTNSKPLPSN